MTTTFSIEDMESIDAAISVLKQAKDKHVMANGSHAVWKVLDHAINHLELRLSAMTNDLMGKGEK